MPVPCDVFSPTGLLLRAASTRVGFVRIHLRTVRPLHVGTPGSRASCKLPRTLSTRSAICAGLRPVRPCVGCELRQHPTINDRTRLTNTERRPLHDQLDRAARRQRPEPQVVRGGIRVASTTASLLTSAERVALRLGHRITAIERERIGEGCLAVRKHDPEPQPLGQIERAPVGPVLHERVAQFAPFLHGEAMTAETAFDPKLRTIAIDGDPAESDGRVLNRPGQKSPRGHRYGALANSGGSPGPTLRNREWRKTRALLRYGVHLSP